VNKHNSQLATRAARSPPGYCTSTFNLILNTRLVRVLSPSTIGYYTISDSITSTETKGDQRHAPTMSMYSHDQICPPATPANVKQAKANVMQYSINREPVLWCLAHMTLSQHYALEVAESSGPTWDADQGIEHTEEALKVISEQHHAPTFATAQCALARLYPKRVAGNRTENLTKALACAEVARRVCKQTSCPPSSLAEAHAIIGSIYADNDFESSNSRAANEDLAIRHYLASLQRSSMHEDSDDWADRQLKVALVYYKRTNGRRRSNAKVVIKHVVEALKVFTKSEHPKQWAKCHQGLVMSYSMLFNYTDPPASWDTMSEEEFSEEISPLVEKCITSCKNALQIFSTTYDPAAW
jgi:hypothetical protein